MSNHEGLPLRAQDNSQESYNSIQNESEYQKELQRKRVNAIYSSVLTLISFQERKTPDTKEPLVIPYYEKALRTQKQAEQIAKKEAFVTGEPMKKIEKIPGENPKDRKNYAYLERLDLAIERGGNRLEKRIWQESIKNFAPIIEKENIKNNTWVILKETFDKNRKEQGLPPAEYTESEMNKDYERLRQNQIDSINSWTEYLSNKETPFPTWFKIYAFDSVIKMGTYNHKYGKYENRDKSTIAPYPRVNPAALALTLDAVNNFFGQDKEKWFTEHTDDDQLNAIVKSGNFGKIYTHFFNETYKPIPTPERTEDIKGEWFDFYPGQEDELAEASQGTPWCIASKQAGENCLKTNDHTIKDNKARFKLFKLKNENSIDGISKTACASIRFDTQGRVAEVSGLKGGQAIEDSLIPIVEQEAFKYPLDPDRYFKEKFRDKKELIRLQEKAKNSEDLTLDEYAFLYEKDRKIFTLDTYASPDPKIAELRNIYNISRLLQSDNKDALGQDLLMQKLECVLKKTSSSDLAANLDTLLEKGIDLNTLFNKLNSNNISQNLDTLLEKGIDVNAAFNRLDSDGILQNLDTLLEKGIDLNTLFNKLNSNNISRNLNTLLKKGININSIFDKLDNYYISQNFDTFLEKGIDVNVAFNKLNSYGISQNLNTLLKKGINVNSIFDKLDSYDISQNLNTLLKKGINVNAAFNRLDSDGILQNLDTLLEKGASINTILDKLGSYHVSQNLNTILKKGIAINDILDKLGSYGISQNLNTLLKKGIDVNAAFNRLDSYDISRNLNTFLEKGINVNSIFNKLDNYYISQNLNTFLEKGIDTNTIFNKLGSYHVSQNLNSLLEKGIDVDIVFDKLDSYDISQNLNIFLKKGINVNSIFNKLDSYGVSQNLDTLLENSIDINAAFNKLDSYGISQNLDTLLENSVDVNRILNRLDSNGVSLNFELLANHNIPTDLLVSKMNLQGIESHLDIIQTDPANIKAAQLAIYCDILIDGFSDFTLENINNDVIYDKILDNQLDSIIKGGNLELAMNKMMEETLPDSLKTFLEQHPADFNSIIRPELYSKMVSELIESYKDSDEVVKLNDDRVIRSLIGPDLIYNLNNLLQVMPIDRIVANMRPADIEAYHDELVAHGASL